LVVRLAGVLDLADGQGKGLADDEVMFDSGSASVDGGLPAAGLSLQILGPLEAWRDGAPLALGPPRQRAVLGLLALSAGASVHRDMLVDALWGDDPPAAAVNEVQACVGRLRAVLDPDRSPRDARGLLVSAGTSYRLQLGVHGLDWLAFREMVGRAAAASSAGATTVSLDLYERALRLWKGLALADVDALRGHPAVMEAHRVWAAAVADFANAAVELGQVELVLPDLWRWVERDPLNEKACALLMIALAEVGQQAMALTVFADIRERLDAQLGLQPGPDLSAAHLRVLRQEGRLPAALTDTADRYWVVPRQLPAGVRHFVGRGEELKALSRAADTAGAADGVVPIVVISGTAGVGKSALALQWAHQNSDAFPDGQIYVNLHGFDPAGPALSPSAAMRMVIDALGVPARSVPLDQQAQAALYRSLVAGRRVLIVLDNARDAEHARMLLPGSPGPVVVVTSRTELTSLVAIEGAKPVQLPMLDSSESRHLIIGQVGVGEVTERAEAVDELIALCGGLPLALSIVAARAASRPDLPLGALATQLRDARGRLDALSVGEAVGDLRAVFSCSYVQLDASAARMFRLIGLHPGSDISIHAAASLAGVSDYEAGRLLEQLTRAHLLTQLRSQRWDMHDLLKAYAAEQVTIHDGEAERRDAIRRLLDSYLHTAHAAARLLEPGCDPLKLPSLSDAVAPELVSDDADAMRWFAAEHHTLMNAIDQAANTGHETHAWQLAWTIFTWCSRRGLAVDLATAQRTALQAAQRTGDHVGQAHARVFLSRACGMLDLQEEAETHLQQAFELFQQVGDDIGQATVHLDRCRELDRLNQPLPALHHAQRFLELMRATDDRIGEAVGLNSVGWCHARLGDHAQGLRFCHQALQLSHELGYRPLEARTWDSLGYANLHLGRLDEAADCYQHALELYVQLGDEHLQAVTLDRLGDTHAAAGNRAAARSSWRQAGHILERMHLPGCPHRKLHREGDVAGHRAA
jgi:DNA-binding SARP family transcriptional activator/tetratricopeptide (TPR) repeat protein